MKQIMCVRDAKSDMFGNPFFCNAVGEAIRSFTTEINRAEVNNTMYSYPEDFSLYHIGVFDEQDGTMNPFPLPKMILQGDQVSEVKKGSENITSIKGVKNA